jgi:CRP/FNR family transcriptional regulator, anaerobic regulatory protein
VLSTAQRHQDPLPAGHPCLGCEVRTQSACGVLDTDLLARFRCLGGTQKLMAGEPLFHEGDQARQVYTLTAGSLKLYKLLPDGRRHVTGFMFPGDFLGITMDDEHAFSAESLEESRLCRFPRSRFDEFVDQHSPMERELYRLAAHELAAAQQQMVLLGRKTAAERLASFLLDLAARDERASGSRSAFVRLPMSRADIADYLGLTKETVSRVLALLKKQRLVRLEALDVVQILDRDGLAELADGHCGS